MKIAIPLSDGTLSRHFGHCDRFALVDVDPATGRILKREDLDAPPHQPGLLPPWLASRGANLVIAGGMGVRARELFAAHGVEVVVGAGARTPEALATDYVAGNLSLDDNPCDH